MKLLFGLIKKLRKGLYMKNKFLLGILSASLFASFNVFADVSVEALDGKMITIPSAFNSVLIDGLPDVYAAVSLGDKEFIKNALSLDPSLFKKYNDLNPRDPIGFDVYDIETVNIVLQSDPDLLSRVRPIDGRNLPSSMLFQHWDKLTHEKDIKYFEDYEAQVKNHGIKMRENQTMQSKNKKLLNEVVLASLAYMPEKTLNSSDTFGNTTLHYAVGRNMPEVVDYLINNPKFLVGSRFNIYGETPIFMLTDNSCQLSDEEKKLAQDVLRILLKAKISLFQKNITGFSFPALVYGLPNLDHLKQVLEEEVPASYLNLFKNEGSFVKKDFEQSKGNKLYTSMQQNGYWTTPCRYFEEKNTVKVNPRIEQGRYKLNTK